MRLRPLLLAAILLLAAANVAAHFYRNWGLITIRAKDQPLSRVIAEIERQGRVSLRTPLDPARPVTLHVVKVPLTEALETLATVADARWRLAYVLAPDRAALREGVEALRAADLPDSWKRVAFPGGNLGFVDRDGPPPDPRDETWILSGTSPAEPTLRAWLEQIAAVVEPVFYLPSAWNPPLAEPPPAGRLDRTVAATTRRLKAAAQPVFTLTANPWSRMAGPGAPPPPAGEDRTTLPASPDPANRAGRPGRPPFSPEAMEARARAQIAKLPPGERPKAEEELQKRRAFFEALRDLPPEERREKMREMFNDPAVQNRIADAVARRDARMTPEQRLERYRRYVERKAERKNQP